MLGFMVRQCSEFDNLRALVLLFNALVRSNLEHNTIIWCPLYQKLARWPHGCRRQCSEVAVSALVGSNPTEGGGFFRRKETPPGHGCVSMSIRG
jgi:hypothetical protein